MVGGYSAYAAKTRPDMWRLRAHHALFIELRLSGYHEKTRTFGCDERL